MQKAIKKASVARVANFSPQLTVVSNNLVASPLSDKEVGKVYQTFDYGKFKLVEGNREISQANLNKLEVSMCKFGQLMNIVVDKDMKVLDGQHRLELCRKHKWPVRYEVREDGGLSKVQEMQIGKAWGNKDYLKSYTQKHATLSFNTVPYTHYEQFIKDFKLGHNMTLALICGTYSNRVPTQEFKNGTLMVSDHQYMKARKEAKMIEDFAPYYKGYKRRVFVLAVLTLLKKVKGYNHDHMMAKMAKFSAELKDHGKTEHYVKNLIEEIYNRHVRRDQRLSYNPNDIIAGG